MELDTLGLYTIIDIMNQTSFTTVPSLERATGARHPSLEELLAMKIVIFEKIRKKVKHFGISMILAPVL